MSCVWLFSESLYLHEEVFIDLQMHPTGLPDRFVIVQSVTNN